MPRGRKRKIFFSNKRAKKTTVNNSTVSDEMDQSEDRIDDPVDEEVTSEVVSDENICQPGCNSNVHVTGSVIQIITLSSDTSLSTSIEDNGTVSSVVIPLSNSEPCVASEVDSVCPTPTASDHTYSQNRDSAPEVIEINSEEEGAEEKPMVETACDKNEANDCLSKGEKDSSSSEGPECPVCLQTCVHPAKLPCSHIFCYLCLKGIARSGQPCPMCRASIPFHCAENPQLLPQTSNSANAAELQQVRQEERPVWFYEGRHGGWWQFEERMSNEIEENHSTGVTRFEIMICGQLYVIDTFSNIQYPKMFPMRVRRIIRDLPSRIRNKGVAGIHLGCLPSSTSPVKKSY